MRFTIRAPEDTPPVSSSNSIRVMTAIRSGISARGWIGRTHQHMVDPADSWPVGDGLTDT